MLQTRRSPTRTRSIHVRCADPLHLYPAALLAYMRESHFQGGTAELTLARPGPLDEGDPVGAQVVVEQRRVLVLKALQAVEVEVGDRQPPAHVALADREGGRGDGAGDSEGAAGAADQGRLAGAELAREEDDVARPQALGDTGAERFGLGGALRLDYLGAHPKNPSWS